MVAPAYYPRQAHACLNEQQRDELDRLLVNSAEPAPIDLAAFGKRLGEIITIAVRASPKRQKFRT
jgi:hypothetical protein